MPGAGGNFEINVSGLVRTLNTTGENLGKAAQDGAKEIAREWKRGSRDEAPIDTGQLRRDISEKLNAGSGANVEIEMASNTHNGGFNYAYYQHEVRGNNYLDTVAEENEDKWRKHLEGKLEAAAKKAGW
ncbi:HK97 gp10 family phage protein [Salibacterium aidingense]|uniref:HK97 gp10 family phage protein n=1 Tax=Salibacterium aidingense TaxID=384933 RepID=UPI003BC59A20